MIKLSLKRKGWIYVELNEGKTNRELTTQELFDWEYNLTDQQRAFITCRIESRAFNRVADEMEPLSPAIARLIREYI